MPKPGSSDALVLPSATSMPGATESPGARAVTLAKPFVDPTQYAAVAVVHGKGKRAPAAFDVVKQRLVRGRGLIWLPDPDLIDLLTGDPLTVAALKKILKPKQDRLVTFASIQKLRVTGGLEWFMVGNLEVDEEFLKAGLN